MKFVMLIVNEEYEEQIEEHFRHLHCYVTKIASTGEFLQYGEVVYLVGASVEQVESFIEQCQVAFANNKQTDEFHMRMYVMKIDRFMKNGGRRI